MSTRIIATITAVSVRSDRSHILLNGPRFYSIKDGFLGAEIPDELVCKTQERSMVVQGAYTPTVSGWFAVHFIRSPDSLSAGILSCMNVVMARNTKRYEVLF